MIKLHLLCLTICSTQAAYISRMATVNRIRSPSVFRPGVTMQRPWYHQRLVPAASHRAPYVIYRGPPQRYAIKHYAPGYRNTITWKAQPTRLPIATPQYELVRAASSNPSNHDGGAIHTIPAPNLSLSEKPIVVVETTESVGNAPVTQPPKSNIYEVTENYPDIFQLAAKIQAPMGLQKVSLPTPELSAIVRNGAALQFASEYGLPAIALPAQQSIVPQQFTMQGFSGIPTQQDLLQAGAEGIIIPPNALYQPDPNFLQKLQAQLLQRLPTIEFIPYAADTSPQVATQASQQPQASHQKIVLLENEQFITQNDDKNVVQRQTSEGTIVTLVPQQLVANSSDNQEVTEASQPHNITVAFVPEDPPTTTVKVVETTTEQKTTPIYYAQVGQSIGNAVANSVFSAVNDVRAAIALAQVEKPREFFKQTPAPENHTTTLGPELKAYFVQTPKSKPNETVEIKPLLGVPFAKKADSVNVAYTLVRTDTQKPKVTQNGAVYAGQIVEATVSEDHDFNKEKANLLLKRPPLRLLAVNPDPSLITSTTTPQPSPKVTVVKAKIPPKSKLTFDDKTGEPVLRIYASYVDSPKDIVTKLASAKTINDVVSSQDALQNWKAATLKGFDKGQGFEASPATRFGLKLRSRSDDYIPLFEEYED